MGREKKTSLAAVTAGRTAKERHQKTARDNNACTALIRTDLVALPEKNITSKHKSYFQIFENHDKKEKKLEFEVTTNKIPPPGFEFVPIGNPELTKACKDLSRERDAMIFIVSTAKDANANKLALQMSRSGHHIRRTIVEEARALIGEEDAPTLPNSGEPEPIPDSQEEYNARADAALRDLFPRIPNTDRQMIIEHAFKKGGTFQGQPVVGMVESLPLSRRVQLAVLAHIRHNHTRYDQLLREAGYPTARKVVEQHCLDFLVKWRGDEETGRDQFDEILREVIVLSDDSDEDSEDDESSDEEFVRIHAASGSQAKLTASPRAGNSPRRHTYPVLSRPTKALIHKHPMSSAAQGGSSQRTKPQRSKKTNRGFKRYEAVAKRWEEAVNRNRYKQNAVAVGHASPMDRMPSQGPRRLPSLEIISPVPRAESPRHPYVTLAPSHLHHGGHYQSQPHRPNDRPPVADFEPQRHAPVASYADPQSAPQPGYQSVPSEAMIVGRRITRVPVSSDRQSGPAPLRSYHEELKDYLVPSIEPPSPHSGPDVPLFVRQVIRGGPTDPEQVPSGRSVPYSRPLPLQIYTGDFRYDQSHPGNGGRPRPAMPSHVGEQVVTQREYYHGPQPNLAMSAPEHARRVYRVREPIEDNRRSREVPVIASKRVIRVQREAPPPGSWKPDLSRMRVFSPPRMNQFTARTLPSVAYENAEPRRVFYREASASRFDGYEQGPGSSSAQLHQREATRPPSPGFWQGSTFNRPDALAPVRPTGTAVHQGYPSRPMFHEMSPTHQVVEGYNHRGHAYQEAPQTTQHARSVSSDVKYMHEQPVPNRDVVMLRQ